MADNRGDVAISFPRGGRGCTAISFLLEPVGVALPFQFSPRCQGLHSFRGCVAFWGTNLVECLSCLSLSGSIAMICSTFFSGDHSFGMQTCWSVQISYRYLHIVFRQPPLIGCKQGRLFSTQVTFMPQVHFFIHARCTQMSMGAICFTSSGSNSGCWVILVVLFLFVLKQKCSQVTTEKKPVRQFPKKKYTQRQAKRGIFLFTLFGTRVPKKNVYAAYSQKKVHR